MCPEDIIKVVGDSLTYNYNEHYPIECWFIDGEHVYNNAYVETGKAIESGAKYIIYHDADIKEIYNAIEDSFNHNGKIEDYDLYLFQDESVKNVNYDFLYTMLLGGLFPYRVRGFTLQFENDDRFILTASLEETERTAAIILEQKLEDAEILGYGFEDQLEAARC